LSLLTNPAVLSKFNGGTFGFGLKPFNCADLGLRSELTGLVKVFVPFPDALVDESEGGTHVLDPRFFDELLFAVVVD